MLGKLDLHGQDIQIIRKSVLGTVCVWIEKFIEYVRSERRIRQGLRLFEDFV